MYLAALIERKTCHMYTTNSGYCEVWRLFECFNLIHFSDGSAPGWRNCLNQLNVEIKPSWILCRFKTRNIVCWSHIFCVFVIRKFFDWRQILNFHYWIYNILMRLVTIKSGIYCTENCKLLKSAKLTIFCLIISFLDWFQLHCRPEHL